MWSASQLCHRVGAQLEQLGGLCQPRRFELRTESVSGWSVGEHVQHLVLADRSILDAIGECLGGSGGRVLECGSPSLAGRMVLASGWIPRGRAKSPQVALPSEPRAGATASELAVLAERLRVLAQRERELGSCRRAVAHPLLGPFTPLRWLRFVDVHHRHHMAIVAAIERAAAA